MKIHCQHTLAPRYASAQAKARNQQRDRAMGGSSWSPCLLCEPWPVAKKERSGISSQIGIIAFSQLPEQILALGGPKGRGGMLAEQAMNQDSLNDRIGLRVNQLDGLWNRSPSTSEAGDGYWQQNRVFLGTTFGSLDHPPICSVFCWRLADVHGVDVIGGGGIVRRIAPQRLK